jgi:hypothetical protein
MTTERLFRILLRRWYVVVLGVALVGAVAVRVHQTTGLYWSQVDVVFTAPPSPENPNNIKADAHGLTSIAGMVAAELNRESNTPMTSSAGATLAGQGVRQGFQIRLPNSGGQWATNFDRPVLDVQVIGPDAETVREQMVQQVARIDQVLDELQDEDAVASNARVSTLSAPTSAQVFYLDGSPTRAAVMAGILGLWLTVLSAVLLDGFLVRRRRVRQAVAATAAAT